MGANVTIVDIVDTDTVDIYAQLPLNLFMSAAYRMRTATGGIGANTDYAAPIFQVEEWVVP